MSKIDRWSLIAAAIFGAFLGSRLLHIAQYLPSLLQQPTLQPWLNGKSVLGGFLGGTLGVEIGKKLIGWKKSTGDGWVLPLAVGLIIGRIGCQLAGLWDQTYGNVTHLPWGWDYGDGIARHPTALYEIVLLTLLLYAIRHITAKTAGLQYATFMLGYCSIRLMLEWFKPPFGPAASGDAPIALYAGLTAIQWAAIGGALYFTNRCWRLATTAQTS